MSYDYDEMLAVAGRVTRWMREWGVAFDAADVLHEALYDLWRKYPEGDYGPGFVVRSVWISSRRLLRADRRQRAARALTENDRAPNNTARDYETSELLGQALAYLAADPDGRVVLALAVGYTARDLDNHPANVMRRAELGRARLAEHLGWRRLGVSERPDPSPPHPDRLWRAATIARMRARHTPRRID